MKAKKAIKMLGGMKVIDDFAKKLSEKYGLSVEILPHINEEKPSDNWLNVIIETPNRLFDKNGYSDEFDCAEDEICEFLAEHELGMEYECGGDGGTGPIDSYRVY